MRRRRGRYGWLAGVTLGLAALASVLVGGPASPAAADDAPLPMPAPSSPLGPEGAPPTPGAEPPAPAAPPISPPPPAPPVGRLTLDKAVAKHLLAVAGERPASYARVELVLTNRSDETLCLDLSGHHLRPTTSGCQRLGLSHPVTPRDPAPAPAPSPAAPPAPPATPPPSAAAPGIAPLDLAPGETRRVLMNTCCMDAGRPCPRAEDRFVLASGPTPPNVEVALRWWTDHPTAPQGFVNQAIWANDLRLLSRTFDREAPGGRREPIGPKGRMIRSYGGTLYTLDDGVLTSLDAEGIRRFHGTQIYDVHPRADALYGIGQGIDGNDLWRFAATGEPPWGKVFPLGPVERLLDLVPLLGGGFLTRTDETQLLWRAGKDAAPTSCVSAEERGRLSVGPADAAKGRFVAIVRTAGKPKAGMESVGPSASAAVSSKFFVMDIDARTGAATLRKVYWNVRDMRAGPGGVFALSPVGLPERLDGEKLRRLPGGAEFDVIVLVGKARLVLRTKDGELHGYDVATGRSSPLPAEIARSEGRQLSIDPVTDDLVWVGEEGFRRLKGGAAAVEAIP